MSVSGITSGYSCYQTANSFQTSSSQQKHKQEFDALSQALQSGNLSSAQQAFTALQQDAQPAPPGNSDSGGVVTDISSLGQALSSNDLSSAQTAFAQLQKDIQSGPQGMHDGPPPPPPGSADGNNDQVQQAFSDLATALQKGDLDAAKTAFATLQSLSPDNQTNSATTASSDSSTSSTSSSSSSSSTSSSSATSNTSSNSTDTLGSDLSSLSDALQNGDLSSAQSLFQNLLTDLQSNAPHHHGIHHYQQNSASTSTDSNVSVSA